MFGPSVFFLSRLHQYRFGHSEIKGTPMKYTHFGIVVISLTVAGVAYPVRAASLPTYKLPTSSTNQASVAVEETPNELNAAPWSAGSQPQVEHSIAGDLAGDMSITEAQWKTVLADGSSPAGQPSLVDTLSMMGSPADRLPEVGQQPGNISRGLAEQAAAPIDYRAASDSRERKGKKRN